MTKLDAVAGVYRITNTTNGKIYVGSAVNVEKRWQQHRAFHPGGIKMLRALIKYGVHAFVFEILEVVFLSGLSASDKKEKLLFAEQVWLDKLQPFGENGYNLAPRAGSILGLVRSSETVDKIRKANTGKKRTPEAIANIRRGRAGYKPSAESIAKRSAGNRGKKLSDETKQKIRLKAIGRRHTAETKLKLSKATSANSIGHTVTAETRRKISIANRGNANGRFRKRKSKLQLPLL